MSLEEFGERGLRAGDDLVAAVMGRLEGGLAGLPRPSRSSPKMRWPGRGSAVPPDPARIFRFARPRLLEGVAASLSEALRVGDLAHDARLVETSEPCLLAETHAPSDTLVVSARLRIVARDESVSAVAHLLVEPKYFARSALVPRRRHPLTGRSSRKESSDRSRRPALPGLRCAAWRSS